MTEYTKEDLGCYHSLIKYLATKENTDRYKILRFATQEELMDPKKKKNRLMYYSYDINIIDKEGQVHPYILDNLRYDHSKRAIIPDHILVKVLKSTSDFSTIVKGVGSYTDSLGGGWSQKVSMYRVDDKYFADMDCAH